MPTDGLQIQSLIRPEGGLEIRLAKVATPPPGPDEVVVRIDAAPLNPSDMGLLFGGADMTTATASDRDGYPIVTAPLAPAVMQAMAGRVGQSLPVGNEGGGVVVEAGSSAAAQALLGRTVGVQGGAMYSQYRTLKVAQCLPLPEGTSAVEGAACFVNPLTTLGMVGTMRLEGHKALVHTAAASNLGQMLVKLCRRDGIGLVNVVRRPEQADLLKSLGAEYVCDSSSPTFMADLTDAIEATGATIAFDAIGGGSQGGQILAAMEAAVTRSAAEYSRYGSNVHKQLYIYGSLDRGPTTFVRAFGMVWGMGGWLLGPFLQRVGAEEAQRLRERVAAEIKTTFASSYTREVTLREALSMEAIAVYSRQATGEKYLITPNRD